MLKMLSNEAKAIETLFNIQTKEGLKVPYKLNDAQRFFDDNDSGVERKRIIVAKARQRGFSSIILAKFGIRCMSKEGTHAVVVSHEADATQRLLDKVHYYLKHINGPKPIFGRNSRTELYFDKRDSTYYVGTAGSKAFGRGDFITDLHCSEYAFWDNPEKHSTGLFQAVPHSGRIYIESTGNGRNNDFYYVWEQAEKMGFTRIFYPWFAGDEYKLPLEKNKTQWKPDTPKFNSYMLDLKHRHHLDDEQMWWYESKLRELRENISSMQQEYPSEPEECFQASGGAIFTDVTLSHSIEWKEDRFDGYFVNKHTNHPKSNFHYVLGADPSGGTGHDDASAEVFCAETLEQVFESANDRQGPIAFADFICKVGKHYNEALIVGESNNHGAAVIPYLKDNYPRDKIYKRKSGTASTPPIYGWNSSQETKHAIIGIAQEALPELTIYGTHTIKELKGFEETQDGKLAGKSDNTVIATCLCTLGLQKYESYRKDFLRPSVPKAINTKPNYMVYSLEGILKDLKRNSTSATQVGRGYPLF
jgi:hypothetical protein